MRSTIVRVLTVVAVVFGACGSEELLPPRGTVTTGLDLEVPRFQIYRSDGTIEEVVDEELFLASGTRVAIWLTVVNESDGWWPINFELCTDNADAILPVYLEYDLDNPGFRLPDTPAACVIMTGDAHPWPKSEQGMHKEYRIGGVVAMEDPGSGYLSAWLRIEMPDASLVDIIEYTLPYTVLP